MIDKEKIIEYWRSHAKYDMETAQVMFDARRYPYCLFMCHLAIEKIPKARYVEKMNQHAPYTHDVRGLAKEIGLQPSEERLTLLFEINEFNMEARYPDWQDEFYVKATETYTQKYLGLTKDLFVWLNT